MGQVEMVAIFRYRKKASTLLAQAIPHTNRAYADGVAKLVPTKTTKTAAYAAVAAST